MRRIVLTALALAPAIALAFPACRCDRVSATEPVVLAPPTRDATDDPPAACGTTRTPVRGIAHATPGKRTFHVWTPTTYDGTRPLPVLFAVHGMGSDGVGFEKWFKMEQFTEDAAIVVYPDSKKGLWDVNGDTDLQFFDAMIDGLGAAYCIDRTRVFAIGFSYGGKMVHHLGCKRTARYRAISVGDGSWNDGTPKCAGQLPVLVTHRTRDHDELLAWGKDAAVRWAKVNGCSSETEPTDAEHGCFAWRGCAPGATVTFCEDKYFNEKWPRDWNHTIREEYLRLTWRWFASL